MRRRPAGKICLFSGVDRSRHARRNPETRAPIATPIATPTPATINDTEIETIASGLKSVAHPLRLGMLCLLADGELSVGDICDALGTSQPNISHHLSLLANRRLLTARKDANRVLYALANRRMVPAIELLRQVYCR